MAFVHGKATLVAGSTVALSGYLNQYSAGRQSQAVATTTFGNDDEVFIGGLLDSSMSLGGVWDGDAGAIDATFNSLYGAGEQVVTIGHGGGTIGNGAYLFNGHLDDYGIQGAVNDAVRVSSTWSGSQATRTGVMLHDLEAETATGNFASVDQAASSSNGGVANLNVTAFTGTNVTIKVQDSANNSTWADLITFSTVTGATSERATVTGTVDRYVRAIISAGTFTSVTFTVAFARNRQ